MKTIGIEAIGGIAQTDTEEAWRTPNRALGSVTAYGGIGCETSREGTRQLNDDSRPEVHLITARCLRVRSSAGLGLSAPSPVYARSAMDG